MADETFPPLTRVTELDAREAAALRRRVSRGELRTVHPGVHVDAAAWAELTPRRRHVLQAIAALPAWTARLVVSHETAAAVHGCPRLGDWPRRVQVTDPERTRGQATAHAVKHAAGLEPGDVWTVSGLAVTSPGRTAADLLLTQRHGESVVLLDDLLHRGLIDRSDVEARVRARPRARARVSALRSLAFASPHAESAGESLTRVLLDRIGAPVPALQRSFDIASWYDPRVDFWFPDQGVVLEFDGVAKYTRSRYRGSRTAAQVVVDEKIREDAIRNLPEVRGFVRCLWEHLREPDRLRALLVGAGVPCRT